MTFSLFACGDTSTDTAGTDTASAVTGGTDTASALPSDTDSSAGTSSVTSEPDLPIIPEDTVDNKVLAIDQIKERAVIYDLDAYQEGDTLEDLEIWSLPIGHAGGIKYREDTVFGDVIIVAGSKSAIYEYPSGKELWSTINPGNNPHSIEILPSGNVVIANSTGNSIRLFAASSVLKGDVGGGQRHIDYPAHGAHGVLWDPEYDVLWVLGGELRAYGVYGSGVDEKLTKVNGMGCGVEFGHDLQPDMLDSRYLYVTAGKVYRYDKENDRIEDFPYSVAMQFGEIKGFSHNQNNKYFSTGPLGGAGKFFEGHWKASWLTDTIYFYAQKVSNGRIVISKTVLVSEESAFYKVRALCGQYQ